MNILMTGCGSGVGATIRKNLIEQGHKVCGLGLNGPDIVYDLSKTIVGALTVGAAEAFFDGGTDVLICNAGTTIVNPIVEHTSRMFRHVLETNLIAPFALTRCVFSRNMAQPVRYIYTSSMGAKLAMRMSPGYCASKAGLEAMIKSLAKECAGKYSAVFFGIAPGTIENTEMSEKVIRAMVAKRGMTESEARQYAMQSPLGRAATHDEVWKLFDFCVNHAPDYCTGEIFRMPSGMGI